MKREFLVKTIPNPSESVPEEVMQFIIVGVASSTGKSDYN